MNFVFKGAAMECRVDTLLGGIPFECPRKYAPFNEKDEDIFCCGREVIVLDSI
jgi:hypothetical protein